MENNMAVPYLVILLQKKTIFRKRAKISLEGNAYLRARHFIGGALLSVEGPRNIEAEA